MTRNLRLALLLLLPFWRPLEADEVARPWKSISASLGLNYTQAASMVRLGSQATNLSSNLEELLGVDRVNASLRVDAYWRFSPNQKHRLDFTWYSLNRGGHIDLQLPEPFNLDDKSIAADASVTTKLELDVYQVSYSYSFFQDERLDLAGGLSVFIFPLNFDLDAIKSGEPRVRISKSITVPLPVLYGRVDIAVTPKFFLRIKEQILYLEVDDFRALVTNSVLGAEYLAFENVGFGLSLDWFKFDLKSRGSDYPSVDLIGRYEISRFGATVYAKLFY